MNPEPVRVLVTGGTFDKEYNELTGSLAFRDTHLPEMLRLGRCRVEVTIQTLMMIDSLEMTDADRARIVGDVPRRAESRILITHGTDTMVETAAALAAAMTDAGKTIVLTGAMIPYAFGSSDGLFNLGSALSFVQVLPPGVYIATTRSARIASGSASRRRSIVWRRRASASPRRAAPCR